MNTDTPRAAWRAFAIVAAVHCLVVMNDTVVFVALPSIGRMLGLAPADLGWVMNAYLLSLGGFLLVGGRLADRFGRRRVLIAGLIGMSLASALAALAWCGPILIGARAAQGIAGALVAPAAMSAIADIFRDTPERAKATGLLGGVSGIAGSVGALAGAGLTDLGWRATFWFCVPTAALLAVLVRRQLPDRRGDSALPDLLAAGAFTGGVTLILLTITGVEIRPAAVTALTALSGMAALAVAWHRQRTARDPLLPRALTRSASTPRGIGLNAVIGFGLFGGFLIVTLFLQELHGLDPLPAAAWMLPISGAMFAGSLTAVRLLGHVPAQRVLRGALIVQAIGLGCWAVATQVDAGLPGYGAAGALWGLGVGASLASAFVWATHDVPLPAQGAAAGAVNTALQIGGAAGVAVLGWAASASGAVSSPGVVQAIAGAAVLMVAGIAVTGSRRSARPVSIPPELASAPAAETFDRIVDAGVRLDNPRTQQRWPSCELKC